MLDEKPMTEFDRMKARKDAVLAKQAASAVIANPAYAKLLETVTWIASQQNLFFAECSQAEEIIVRCKEALQEDAKLRQVSHAG